MSCNSDIWNLQLEVPGLRVLAVVMRLASCPLQEQKALAHHPSFFVLMFSREVAQATFQY